MRAVAVIGKNYGDEGKGLACAALCRETPHSLIVRHNGGGQAGHTVTDSSSGTQFIHHQIGSGAEYGAATLLAETFHPDLYQLGREVDEFKKVFGLVPCLFAERKAEITTIDDILLNMGVETERGSRRHGSCGMGINECCERLKRGFSLTIEDIVSHDITWIMDRLLFIRRQYTGKRICTLKIKTGNPYRDLLGERVLLEGFAASIKKNVQYFMLTEADRNWLEQYDMVLFENGQGLLLDADHTENAPYLTASKTGIANPAAFLAKRCLKLDEAIYVTRTYVTRHGAGPLPGECERTDLPGVVPDLTNRKNEWQGELRYALHEDRDSFLKPVINDTAAFDGRRTLLITHLNETDNKLCFMNENPEASEFSRSISEVFDSVYGSGDKEHIFRFWEGCF